MTDKITIMAHKTNGKESVMYYATNLPEWWELVAILFVSCVVAMTVFYIGLWIASKFYLRKEK